MPFQRFRGKPIWGPVLYKKTFETPDPRSRINQLQPPSYFNAMIMLLGPFTKVRLWPSSLVVSPQKRATVNKKQQKQQTSTPDWTDRPTVLFLGKMEAAKMEGTSEEASRQQGQLF